MTYVSQLNTPYQNLEALAKLSYPTTKECSDAVDAKQQQFLATKSRACHISAICLGILGIVVGATVGAGIGALVASLAIIPVCLYCVFSTKAAECDEVIARHANIVNDIALSIASYMTEKRREKQYAILASNGGSIVSEDQRAVLGAIAQCAQAWDAKTLRGANPEQMQEHVTLRQLATAVVAREFPKGSFMNKARDECHKFIHGEHGTYLGTFHDRSKYPYKWIATLNKTSFG